MEKLVFIKPYNDNKLEFNEEIGRYQLTLSYVKNLFEGALPYRNDAIARKRIKQTSLRIYNYIVNHSNTANREVIDVLLNKTEQGRKFLIEVLSSQLEADAEYGYNDLLVRPVINATNGQEGNRDIYIQNAISIETEMLINDSINYFGINICCMIPYGSWVYQLVRNSGE